jgi:hypothetical protein
MASSDMDALQPLRVYFAAFFADIRHGAGARAAAAFNREFAAAVDPASPSGSAPSSSSDIVSTFVDIRDNREASEALLGPIFDAFGSSVAIFPCRRRARATVLISWSFCLTFPTPHGRQGSRRKSQHYRVDALF